MDEDVLVLTIPEAAKILRVSPSLVRELLHRGELPCLRLGRRMLVPRRALERLIEEQGGAILSA